MGRDTIVGGALALVGAVGYVGGVYVPYPGRAFSITALMLGVALAVIGQQSATRGDA